MKTYYWIATVCFCLFCLGQSPAMAQNNATIKEFEKEFKTYPFSDPDPVANPGLIYPYFRFDGFTNKPVQQKWKVVELENDFIKLWVMPQIGGKIWTAIDKKNNRPFIYQNDVIKFRDIAMRGPWTSGGLEANFGIIGHTPGVSDAVDYLTKKNDDGSVSCIISLLDLLTQTRWSMEIRLPKDKAYFTTHVFWHNQTSLDQPYYSWMNLALKADDDLEFIEPGTHHLFHDGKSYDWPYDKEHNRNISFYKQNDFGGSQSYHITGTYSKYWGGFWQKDNYGMIHYANREDKVGKKIWIWGKARSGAIWDKLLNDNVGQYTELQSGRLYIQNAQESMYTPYKQFSFSPYQTDSWTEYWYPYSKTNGVAMADTSGVLNIKRGENSAAVYFSPVKYMKDTLKVWDREGKPMLNKPINLEPLQNLEETIHLNNGQQIGRIVLGSCEWSSKDSTAKVLSRPTKPLEKLDYDSAYGLYIKGKYQADTRYYTEAETSISKSLKLDPGLIPALAEMAMLQYRKMDYESAFEYARNAISLDTYNGMANYYYALSALKLDKVYDAEDGFEVATLTDEYRAAALTELSKIKIRQHKFDEALSYASKSLVYNSENITALQLEYVSARLLQNTKQEKATKERILAIDPFNHFIRFEEYLANKSAENKTAFTGLIRDEMPQQTYLDLAVWYHDLNLDNESKIILETAPQKNDELLYWLAWLHRNDSDAKQRLTEAQNGSALLVFPFRPQSATVIEWAAKNTNDWKPDYYLSLIYEAAKDRTKAQLSINKVNAGPDFAPYYVVRARLCDSADKQSQLNYLTKATKIAPDDLRYIKYLTEFLIAQKQDAQALKTIEPFYIAHKDNYIAGMLYVRCLMANNCYSAAEKILDQLQILPYEGAKDGHKLYEQTKLILAIELIRKGQLPDAMKKVDEARLWPENLGVGAPYPDMVDSSLENSIADLIKRSDHEKPSEKTLNDYLARINAINSI
jgi:Tfp pilus assembly protein PilF